MQDGSAFRSALASFATGVTIVTTQHDGSDVGLTANSFNSVSLDPPMVLWSLGKTSRSLAHFTASDHFAIHILAQHQEELSARFAKRGSDKFVGLPLQRGRGNLPLLEGCVARFQCRKLFEYEGGDHIIFVGEVVEFDHTDMRPLVFHGGRYAAAAPRDGSKAPPEGLEGAVGGLSYLITRAYFALRAPGLRHAEKLGIGWADRYLLGALLNTSGRTISEVNDLIGYTGLEVTHASAQRLIEKGYIRSVHSDRGEMLSITEPGTRYCHSMIAATRASEAEVEMHLGARAGVLRSVLEQAIEVASRGDDGRVRRHMEQIGHNIECSTDIATASALKVHHGSD